MCRGSQRLHVFGVCMALLMTMDGQAAPEPGKPVTEVPRVVMKNLRTEGQFAGKGAIELPRKKFVAIDADLEAGTWGFTRTPCFQASYVAANQPTIVFPENVITHPAVATDPILRFSAMVYRGEKISDENPVAGTVALFANEVKPWQAKVRYLLVTPEQPGEYTIVFSVYDDKDSPKGVDPKEIFKLAEQKIVIR